MRSIGLHLRIVTNLLDMMYLAMRLELKIFQCFLVHQITGLYLEPDDTEVKEFRKLRDEYCDTLYLHASYWINLAAVNSDNALFLLRKEVDLAKRLGFNAIVIHPGSWSNLPNKNQGIEAVAHILNALLEREQNILILLENMAFGQKTIGSDLYDFQELRKKFKEPARIQFCIDTAHAFAYGYDILNNDGQRKFLNLLNETIGLDAVKLLHINDTQEQIGSKRDKHEVIGKGSIGESALKSFIFQPELVSLPLILELPEVSEQEQTYLLNKIRSWH